MNRRVRTSMQNITTLSTVSDETLAALREEARYALARRHFLDFLAFVTIVSDDPWNPTSGPFQPWEFQCERARAWESGQSEVILKARQLGFSWLVASYMLWRAMYFGWAIGYYSRGEQEALAEIENRVLYIWEHLPPALRIPFRKRDTLVQFEQAGSILAFAGTQTAGITYTFQLIVADEAAMHPYGQENYNFYRPTLSSGGQYLAASTANPELGPNGFFYELWCAAEAGTNGYHPVFIPWNARPDRDAAWLAKERAAFGGSENAFNANFPSVPTDAFMGRAGLVFPQFDPQRHVRDSEPVPWEACIARYAGYDLGGGDPTAIVVCGVYRATDMSRRVFQYDEFYHNTGSAPTIAEMNAFLQRWHQKAHFTSIEPDPVGVATTVAQSLGAMGLPVAPQVAERRPEVRRSIQAYYIEHDLLSIHSRCTQSVREFAGYRWKEATDQHDRTRYRTTTPVDHHADAMDARSIVLARIYRQALTEGNNKAAVIRWR